MGEENRQDSGIGAEGAAEFARASSCSGGQSTFLLFFIYLLLVERKQLAVKFYDERYELRVWLYHN